MKKGPAPKPTALKLLEGSRTDRINLNEPKYPDFDDGPPANLGAVGKALWLKLVPILKGAGVLTAGDALALELLCGDYEITRGLEEPPPGAAEDAKTARLALRSADKARDRVRRWLSEFGMTPSSRSRIKATAAAEPEDRLDAFLKGAAK
jgi:P27 family predicted phage terminase small subunit